jgi:HD superfamily phosphohydrolase YqeK
VLGTTISLSVAEYFRKNAAIRGVFNAAQLTIAVGLASLVYVGAGGTPLTSAGFSAFAPFIAAFATFFVSNAMLFAGVFSVSARERFSDVLFRALGGTSIVYDLVGIPLVFGFAYAYVRIGWVWSGALLFPLLALRLVYKANRELQTVNEELLQLMVAAIEARDPYTSGHSQRVAAYSRVVASTLGLSPRATQRVFTAALLHDVGKIHEEFAPILRKPGRLTDDEFEIMKTHSEKGARLVAKVTQFADLVTPIRGHHEAWDGSGYPDKLKGSSIPNWARIIAVADTIDAMTTDRPYRRALTVHEVRAELQSQSGRQFDPTIIASLTNGPSWQMMESAIRTARGSLPSIDAGVDAAYAQLTARELART